MRNQVKTPRTERSLRSKNKDQCYPLPAPTPEGHLRVSDRFLIWMWCHLCVKNTNLFCFVTLLRPPKRSPSVQYKGIYLQYNFPFLYQYSSYVWFLIWK
jgi:hypothetical protein